MNTHQRIARAIGTLFLIALVLNIIANEIATPIIDNPAYLELVYSRKSALILSCLLNMICAVAIILIPLALFPVIQNEHRGFAIGYSVFRGLEGILFVFIVIKTLTLIHLSEKKSLQDAYVFGELIQAEIRWATLVYLLVFCAGALLFYGVLWKTCLIPRLIAVWGLAGVCILFFGTILATLQAGIFRTVPLLQGMAYFAPPIALNEFVLSVWCITRGFSAQRLLTRVNARWKPPA